ncbi:hypothetical protein BOTBODRAFT_131468 [Botryobasidium botryosum FD-172 SS1]|uniref:C4-dicarboxylate transporter/malic acid transport protein n=1 Tax=Botryobasidium botryosum (strain FD-172 SS1) TaxID=930990 RepID=A0A067MUK6_BOTB1|nr:hypothetical protein BOTBODRAFT_131468 [Botryobasidium botryosum FD-172 SS1]
MRTEPSPKASRKGMAFKEVIRHFAPSWFSVCMGTGIVAIILHLFPYGTNNTFLQGLALGFLVLNVTLFATFISITAARYIMFPFTWKTMVLNPTESLSIGTFPMALVTVISGSATMLHQERGFGGEPFLWFLWALWWFDVVVSAMTAVGHVHVIFTRQTHTMESMSASMILPMAPLIVVSSCGGLLSQQLSPISPSRALLTTVVSISCLTIGLGLSLMVTTSYLHRLILHGFPAKGLMVTTLLPLGPLGQGGYAALLFGSNLNQLLPLAGHASPILSSPASGPTLQLIAFSVAFILWSFGIWWLLGAAIALTDATIHSPIPFAMPWWGLIFPLGVYVVLTLQLGTTLDSSFFRIFGSILACVVFTMWGTITCRTVKGVIEGSVFQESTSIPNDNTEQRAQP